jgi:hypothetical protein
MRFALLLLLVPTLAVAQPTGSSSDPSKMHTDDCARARKLGKTCVLDIPAEEIEKGVVRPDTTMVDARIFSDHNSLIRIRKHFIAEILKSANDVD